VASEDTGDAVILRSSDGKLLQKAPVGGEPEGVGVSASAQLLGVTSEEADTVALLGSRKRR